MVNQMEKITINIADEFPVLPNAPLGSICQEHQFFFRVLSVVLLIILL